MENCKESSQIEWLGLGYFSFLCLIMGLDRLRLTAMIFQNILQGLLGRILDGEDMLSGSQVGFPQPFSVYKFVQMGSPYV